MLGIWYNKNSARVGVRSARARAAGTRYPKGTGTSTSAQKKKGTCPIPSVPLAQKE